MQMTRELEVAFRTKSTIEAEANKILARYGYPDEAAPVPVESILEDHLQLEIGFADLRSTYGPKVLGATYLESRRVEIDWNVRPGPYGAGRGRYSFTLAHEAGHWALHREEAAQARAQIDLFDAQSGPSIVCRDLSQKPRIEWQADYFASCQDPPETVECQSEGELVTAVRGAAR